MHLLTVSGPAAAGQGYFARRNRARTLLAAGVAAVALVATIGPADASLMRRHPRGLQAKSHQAKKEVLPQPKGPLIIAISIASQRLTVFDGDVPIAQAPVSTGMAGHPTPMGVFSVIQKEKFHRSNIYSGAPMPFMQRITWSGVAMHAGVLPGYPASHGCIRMPYDFAVRLYGMTRSGARVIITRNDVTPFDFEHSRLALLKKGEALTHTGELRPSIDTGTFADRAPDPAAGRGVKTADASAVTGTSVVDAAKPVEADTPAVAPAAQEPRPVADAPATSREPAAPPPAAAASESPAVETAKAASPAAPAGTAEAPIPAAAAATEAPASQTPVTATAPTEPVATAAAPVAAPSTGAPAEAPAEPVKSADESKPVAAPAAETTATLQVPAPPPVEAPQPVVEVSKPAEAVLPAPASLPPPAWAFVPPSRPAHPLRSGPISVFVSRKEGKLFVRKGFDPLFSVPVAIARPDQPIGTHVFTAAAVKEDGASLRWLAVTLPGEALRKAELKKGEPRGRGRSGRVAGKTTREDPTPLPPQTATQALDRIDLSPELVERLSALMSVGASLIISDQGLGGETGLETDFIVLTR